MVDTNIRHYTIQKKLGTGGMGTVFLATDTRTDTPVAIKTIHQDQLDPEGKLLARFTREGEALRQLAHPNIVAMLEAFEEDGQPYLVMEYVPGGDLEQFLENGPLPLPRILEISLELADALTRAHHLEILHRDIKPANVLLAPDGTLRLTDFGVAHYQRDTNLTQEGALLGTIPYLSPEGCQGKTLDARSDIWSFGVLLYEMLTGHQPFTGDSLMAIITSILSNPIPDLEAIRPDAPDTLVDLVYRMLAKTPEARIPSVRLVGAELEAIVKGFTLTPSGRQLEKLKDSIFTETPTKSRNHLPKQSVRFVGRERELNEIAALIRQDEIDLLTLLGPGGIGKSRLAIESAQRLADEFTHGVHFVGLAPLSSPDQVVSAIADAVEFHLEQNRSPEEQIKNFLANKQLLLILDNFEHLLDGVALLPDLLSNAPDAKILTTSRASLNVQSEYIYEVHGMHAPSHETDTVFEEFDAVELFITYARRTRPDYELSEQEKSAVVQICQLVGGIPLGIELAAGWIRTLPPQEIAEELETDLDFLSSSMSDLPERQRSMRAVFDYSWKLLDEKAQNVLKKLCLFPDGFKREAAKAVGEANVRMLSTLTEQSLIQRSPEGRFRIHELMRHFGKEKLEEDQAQFNKVMQTYWEYYADWLEGLEGTLNHGQEVKVVAQVLEEMENIQPGWAWGVAQQDFDRIEKTLFCIWLTSVIKSKYKIALDLWSLALDALPTDPDGAAQTRYLRWSLSTIKLLLENYLGQKTLEEFDSEKEAIADEIIANGEIDKLNLFHAILFAQLPRERLLVDGIVWGEKMIEVFKSAGKRYELGIQLFNLGDMYFWSLEDRTKAAIYFERSAEITRDLSVWWFTGITYNLGNLARYHGDFKKAEKYLLAGIEAGMRLGNSVGLFMETLFLAKTYCIMGEMEAAKKYFGQAELMSKELNVQEIRWIWLSHAAELDILLGDFETARQKIDTMRKIIENREEEHRNLGHYHWRLGFLDYYQGSFESAYQSFLRSHETSLKHPSTEIEIGFNYPFLVKGAVAVEKFEEAWTFTEESLRHTINGEFWPNTMLTLSGFAELLAKTGKPEEAVEVAAIPANHETTFHYERQDVNSLLEKLSQELPPDVFAAAKARGEQLTPQDVYQRYFGDLE